MKFGLRPPFGRRVAPGLLAAVLGVGACGGNKTESSAEAESTSTVTSPARAPSSASGIASTASAPPAVSSTPPPPKPTTVTYTLHAEAREQPHVSIGKVTIDPRETTVEVTFENRTPKNRVISVDPKGPEALFLESGGKRYALVRAANISLQPKKDKVKPKEKRSFTLVFEALPIDATSFDMFEGEAAREPPAGKATLWAFVDVHLVAPVR